MDVIRRRIGVVAAVKDYFRKYGGGRGSLDIIFDVEDVSPFVMNHLKQVYFSLFLVLLSSVLGSVLHFFRRIGGLSTILGFIVCLMLFSSIRPWNERKRINLLMVAAFCNGASVEFLLRPFINIEGFIITVLVGSALVFGCFAAVASRFTRERFYAYFIAVRFAIIIILIWLFAAVHLFDGNYAYTMYLFVPCPVLWLFMTYMTLYSQVLVILTRQGDCYYSRHCIMFFTDMPALCWTLFSYLNAEVDYFLRSYLLS